MTKKPKNATAKTFVVPPKPDRPDGSKPPAIFVQKQEPVAPAQAKRNIEGRKLPGNIVRVPSRRRNPKGAVGKELNDKIKAMAPGFASNTVAGAADIVELARALKSDVDLIWQFVHDNIEFLPTTGSQKGAWGCLIDGMGNSFDQSDLMIQLLTEAGYSASYMYGELRLTEAEAADWLGTDVSDIYAASNLLAVGGIPNAVVWTGSAYVLDLNHCWVRCTIGMTNYYFDPALKEYEVVSGIDLATAMDYDRTDFMNNATSGATITSDYVQDMNRSNVRSDLNTFASNLVDYIRTNNHAATMDDIIGGRKIVPTSDTPLRQTSHPKLKPMTSPTVWSSIPNGYKAILGVDYDTISVSFYSADIHGKRLTIWFNGSNEAELRLDGSLIATSSAQTPNSWNSVLLTATHPYPTTFADEAHWQTVFEGIPYLIAQAWGNAGSKMTDFHIEKWAENKFAGGATTDENVMGEIFSAAWHTWNSQKSKACDVLNRLTNCTTVLHHQTGLLGHNNGLFCDLGGIVWASSALDNDWNNVDSNDTALAMHGIAFEGSFSCDIYNDGGGYNSTLSIDTAVSSGLKIYDAGSGNWSGTVRPSVTNYTTGQLDDIENWWINYGWRVALPEDGQQTVDDFTGFGYYAISPWYGAVGIITGTLKGRWPRTWLVPPEKEPPKTPPKDPPKDGDPVDLVGGNFLHEHTDLTLGSMKYPYGLDFKRLYNSGSRLQDGVLGPGWKHNHEVRSQVLSNGLLSLGQDSPIRGVAGLVGMFVSIDLYRDLGKPMDKWVTVAMTNQWLTDNISNNLLEIHSAHGSFGFVRLPDGSYARPMGSAATAVDNLDGTFTMTTAQGVEHNFNTDGNISTIVFPQGVTITYSYSSGVLSTVTNGMGRTLTFTHSSGKLTNVSDGTGRSVSFTLDMDGNLEEVENPDSKVTTYSYVAPGMLESIYRPANPIDPIVTNVYDSLNRVMEQTDAYSNLWQFFLAGSRTEVINPANNAEILYLNPYGNVLKRIDREGKSWLNEFDGINRVTLSTTPEGNSMEYEYDELSNILSILVHAKPGSGLSDILNTFTYDTTWNRLATATDNASRTTIYTYDATTGQLLTVERPTIAMSTPTTTLTYTVRGQVETVEDPTGIVTEFTYDSTTEKLEQVVQDVGGLDLTTVFDHNSRGDVISVTDPNGNETVVNYDPLRRVIQVEAPSPFNYITNFTYDDNGNRLTVERETGDISNPWQIYTSTYFIDDLIASVIDPGNQTTSFSYTARRQLWKTTDAASRVVERSYDDIGRLVTVIDPDSNNSSTRTYTDNGLLETIEDANTNVTEYQYDGFDRLKKKIYPDTTFEEMTYNTLSLVTTVTTRAGDDIGFTYDVLNRLDTRSPDSMPTVTYTYDLAGRLLTLSTPTVSGHPESGTFTYGYDSAGRRTSEQYPDSKNVSVTMDDNGNVTRMDYPGSYYIERVFDELNRLTEIKLNGAGTPVVEFDYDQLSRRTGLTYENGASVSYNTQLDDDLDQIVQTFVGSSVTFGYDFNNIHKLTGQSVSDNLFMWHPVAGGTTTYGTANDLNQYPTVGGVSQTYDDNGCLTSDGTWTYGFDTINQLVAATDGVTSASYLYDPMGRQLQKNIGGTKTNYLYSGMQRLADYDGSGSLLQRYVYGTGLDEPLVKIASGGTKTYMHHDRMGNVIAIANSSGAVINRYKYSPWGESPSMSGTTFGFQGQRYDSETGLYYMKARYYDPKAGRFLQPDPIGYGDGLNIYLFGYNNPLNNTDPYGLDVWIEGPSGFDPPLHQSINVGDPNSSSYKSFSYGNIIPLSPIGLGYWGKDIYPGGDILRYKITDPETDRKIIQSLSDRPPSMLGPYWGTCYNCIDNSNELFDATPGKEVPPPRGHTQGSVYNPLDYIFPPTAGNPNPNGVTGSGSGSGGASGNNPEFPLGGGGGEGSSGGNTSGGAGTGASFAPPPPKTPANTSPCSLLCF